MTHGTQRRGVVAAYRALAADVAAARGHSVFFCDGEQPTRPTACEPVATDALARGIVTDVKLTPGAVRRDAVVTTSGLFRDLYPNLIRLIDRAGRLAQQGARTVQESAEDAPLLWALGAAAIGYGLAWLVHGQRD